VKICIMEFRVSTEWGLVGGVKTFEDITDSFFSVQKIDAIFSSEMLLPTYKITRRHTDIYYTEIKRPQRESNHLVVSSVVINLSIFIS